MQLGFFFDQSRCIGCYACVVSCKDWHDIPAGRASWRRVITAERGKFPNVFVTFLSLSCVHCANPPCIPACPADAIIKREADGVVVVDRKACLGETACAECRAACPYEVPQFGEEQNATMQKCDLCLERWREGKKPICVEACPMRALDAGPLEDLKARYGIVRKVEGFIYSEESEPSIVLKPRVFSLENTYSKV